LANPQCCEANLTSTGVIIASVAINA